MAKNKNRFLHRSSTHLNYSTDVFMTHTREILKIAIPSIVSNITVPLLGLVDTAITGHLGAAAYIGAIAVGTSIFSVCYWIFSFLRMGTGGMTAQAYGAKNWKDCLVSLRRGLTVSTILSLIILLLQFPIASFALMIMEPTAEVQNFALLYFKILVWGAPASLGLYVMNGWFIGMQNAKAPLTIAVTQNLLNICASCAFVFGLGWKVEGVATGTLIAQWTGFLLALVLAAKPIKKLKAASINTFAEETAITWGRFFTVNRDIFLRTLCLVAVMFSFTAYGSQLGEDFLAVNAILMQLFLLVSYLMDGFAYAGEAIGGKFYGAKDKIGLQQLTRELFVWGGGLAVLFTAFFLFCGNAFLHLLTDNTLVLDLSKNYLPYIIAVPFVSMAAFIYDGIFIGTTASRGMLISIAIATLFYFGVAEFGMYLTNEYHHENVNCISYSLLLTANHWLWCAYLIYLFTRGAIQGLLMKMGKMK